ncbi:MAG TPA: YfhO family protein [Chthoniobacterales bacterium]|nr:YfhO family protein [Chthoniobacterales bacterium]
MRRHRDFNAALLIAFAPLVYFLPATIGRIVLADADATVFGMPLRILTAEMIREGHLPLWNPYIFCGMPLFASAQAGTLFPLNWGFLIAPPNLAMNITVLLSYAAAGVGAFLYARRSGSNLLGASVTAVVWQFCGVGIGHIAHTNMLHIYAVLPWILWSVDGYLVRPSRLAGALIALIVALGVFAGYPQNLAYSLILASIYVFVHPTPDRQVPWRTRLLAIAFLGIGLLLGGVQIVPILELLQNSMRASVTYDYFASYSLPPVFLLSWFAPYIVGGGDGTLFRAPYTGEPLYPEYAAYVAIAPLILAVVAPFLGRDGRTRFWMWTVLICLLLALGRFLPFEMYRLVYHVPVLHLFRVPARHLMEVDFALAVLAGRAITRLPEVRSSRRLFVTGAATLVVLFLTWSAVTWLRPAIFKMARPGPITLLRAPELFMPLLLAGISAWAVWRFARGRRFAGATLFVVVACDLALWGQFAGWRIGSLRPADHRFATPDFVKDLRREIAQSGPLRILSVDRSLGDAVAQAPATPGIDINLQPDVYMVHRIENAAGYDGFGFKRYSTLAGDMKIWGELPDGRRSLSVSRELDLLNVRYLIAAPPSGAALGPLTANTRLGDFLFAPTDLGLPFLENETRIEFNTPPVGATRVALVTNLAWAADLPDGTVVGRIVLRTDAGRSYSFDIRVGIETSEWAYDRPDLVMRHSRTPIALSGRAEAPGATFESHSYLASFRLPERNIVAGGSIEVAQVADAPKLGLGIQRVSLIDEVENRTFPLRSEWLSRPQDKEMRAVTSRWPERKRGENVVIHENRQALPRTWLAYQAQVLPDERMLDVIRTGKLPDGSEWNPARTVLVADSPRSLSGSNGASEGDTQITRYEPNEVEIAVRTPSPAVLVLADNYYPGWRVSVDGKKAKLLRVDYNLRGVELPPGEHKVRFTYLPRSFMTGAAVSVLTAAALAIWCVRRGP